MEELQSLREFVKAGDYAGALGIIDELEEMSLEGKVNNISSCAVVLLVHLIKQAAEGRTTRSWDNSVRNALYRINKINKRRHAAGYYVGQGDIRAILEDAYPIALGNAALKAFEGRYEENELDVMVNRDSVLQTAYGLITREM